MTVKSDARAVAGERAEALSRLRIALAGGFGNGNFGNDASLEAAIQWVHEGIPNACLTAICDNPKAISRRFRVAAVSLAMRPSGIWRALDTLLLRLPSGLFNWLRAIIIAQRFDVILFPGTGIFDDYRTGPMGFPAQVFRWSVVTRLVGARLIFWATGAGPIINPISRFFLKSAAQCAHERSYRDGASRAFMQGLGVDDSKSEVVPDIAFALPVPVSDDVCSSESVTVGLGVMSYRGWRIDESIGDDYLLKLVAFIRYVERQGHSVRLIVAEPSDKRTLRRLVATIGDEVDRGGESMMTLHDVMRTMAQCDVVVASRFHVLIAALKLGRPCISLSYGPKHRALMTEFGLGKYCQSADRFDFDVLIAHFSEVATTLPALSGIVKARVRQFVARLAVAKVRLLASLAG